jgi:hypothetical protein
MFKRQNRYYTGPISSHFDGVRFFNPGGEAPRGFKDLLRWQFDGERAAWPQEVTHIPARPAPTVDDLTITMIGHATPVPDRAETRCRPRRPVRGPAPD